MRSWHYLISLSTDFSFSFGFASRMTLLSAIIFAFDFVFIAELAHNTSSHSTVVQLRERLPCLRFALKTVPNFAVLPTNA